MAPPYRVVLTGGPCGGKTTSLAVLSQHLHSLGFTVLMCPEVPTLMILGGVSYRDIGASVLFQLESALLRLQMSVEDAFLESARASAEKSVVIFDRGTMDVSAYVPDPMWQAMLDDQGWTNVQLRDARYDTVVHLVTAACGAEAFYTTENNPARKATPEQARSLDARVQDAWIGHPRLRVVDNSCDFAEKVKRVTRAVCTGLGVPEPGAVERKFRVRTCPSVTEFPVHCEPIDIEQIYLVSEAGTRERIRRRGQQSASLYYHSVWRDMDGQSVVTHRQILAREYLVLQARADVDCVPVRKRRLCFMWDQHALELDCFGTPAPGLMLLEASVADAGDALHLPPFLDVEAEVTGDENYVSHVLARRKA
jgi:predicted ATPase/CYTH domain-containing protein